MIKTDWKADNIPDQSGRNVIITGSSGGIGYEAAKVFADKNAKVIIAVRNLAKGEKAKKNIKDNKDNADVEVMLLDLADLRSVKKFADEYKKKFRKLDLLINNAGVMIPPYLKTKDGFELQFGTNHLGHFALTALMIDLIINTENSRIVNVSSNAHKYGRLNFEDLNWKNRKYKAWRAYGDSKISNLYFTYELQRRLDSVKSHIKVTAAHPGWTATELQRHNGFLNYLNKFFAMEQSQGALPVLRAAVDENAHGGDYFGPDGWQEWKGYPVKVNSNKLSLDSVIAGKLWNVSEELTNIKFMIG
ncbi:MAG: SDR family NAD(P)-dependent oxidoreductase [Melioribacteraceae bacterium]|nr:SDR family NAD(P)-dependent oxidoreductase [Melioribacteraceae bacterium]